MTPVCDVVAKMIAQANGNMHDIKHFIKVWGFAKNIGELENLDPTTQYTLELAAIVHDISCPLCRKKYGNTGYPHQEAESAPLVKAFFKNLDVPQDIVDRVTYIVSHHHTYSNVDGLDYQILLEADFIINADGHSMSKEAIQNALDTFYKTKSGKDMLIRMYLTTANQ